MFIKKTNYQALQEIIIDQNQTIDTLQQYIALLKKEIRVYKQCLKISVPDNDIDFPYIQGTNVDGNFESVVLKPEDK